MVESVTASVQGGGADLLRLGVCLRRSAYGDDGHGDPVHHRTDRAGRDRAAQCGGTGPIRGRDGRSRGELVEQLPPGRNGGRVGSGDGGGQRWTDRVSYGAWSKGAATITATAEAASGSAETTVVDREREALEALYLATGGPNWRNNDNWLSDAPFGEWYGVETELGSVTRLDRSDNELSRPNLQELALSKNEEMGGPLPSELTSLRHLEALVAGGTELCAPTDPDFQTCLEGVDRRRVATCGDGAPPMAYLTQAVQSREFPVPLVAEEKALLRVFVTARKAIPTEVDESSLSKSANVEIPAEVIEPGLDMVIEVDPEGTLDEDLLVTKRIPETGRLALDVRAMPVFDLTVIPVRLERDPRFVDRGPRRGHGRGPREPRDARRHARTAADRRSGGDGRGPGRTATDARTDFRQNLARFAYIGTMP